MKLSEKLENVVVTHTISNHLSTLVRELDARSFVTHMASLLVSIRVLFTTGMDAHDVVIKEAVTIVLGTKTHDYLTMLFNHE